MSENRINSLGWFLAGVGLGAVAGVLCAPKSGRKMRRDILAGMDQGSDFVLARGREVRSTVSSWVDNSKDAVEEATDQINSAVDRGKREVGRQKDSITSAIDAGRKAIHKARAD